MPPVDELEIELTANAKKANSAIDNLVTKLDTLSGSLSKIDGSRLSGLANGVAKLGMATKTLSGVKATDYNRIAKGFERFAKIDARKFSGLSSGLNLLAKGMNAIGSVQNLGNITPSINAIKNLAKVNMSGFDTGKLQSIANTMSYFATQMAGVGKIEGSVTRLVSAMARLSSSGQYIGNVATYFPQLGNQVVTLVGKLSSAGAIDTSIAKIVDGIARLASAGKKVQDTVANLDKLGDGVVNLLNRLKNAPQINANIANTIQGLGNLASSGSRISTVSNTATTSSNKLGNALKNLKGRMNGANKASKGFASGIGMFYAKFFLIIRAIKKFGEALGSAQDYIEEFNYFSVALDKIGKDSAEQFKKAGYNSAEEYANSFRSRFSKLQTQLTGYKVDYDTGDATSQMTHNLGLDLTKVMNFNAAIAQITNSAGMLGETSIMTSKALTMLSADWSSLSNQDLSDVMNNMQSALIGQSRAVYKYGIDITNAGLAQTALSHGIRVSIKDLDQQSKMQLRALTMLEQSKVAYGDLARTINQPANQLRMLRAGFHNLARTIGSLFMPIVQKLYPYLNAVVMVLQEFAQWIAKLAGIKLGDIGGSVKAPEMPDYSDAVDDSGKVADNMGKTAKKAKKASDNLQGFDVINKLQENDSDTDTGAGNGKPNNTGLDLSKELADALGNYEKIWDEAFKSNQNKAVQFANKIKKAFLGIAEAAKPTTNAIKKLWNEGLSKLRDFSFGNLMSFWNNFLKPIGKWMLGDDSGLPRFFNITNDLLNNIDWKKLQKSLDGFYKALQKPTKFAWTALMDFYEEFLKPIATWTMSDAIPDLVDSLTELINGIDWGNANSLFKSTFGLLSDMLITIGDVAKNILTNVIPKFAPIINNVVSSLKILIDEALKPLWSFIKANIIPIIEAVLIPLVNSLMGIIEECSSVLNATVKGLVTSLNGLINGDLKSSGEGIKILFSGTWEGIKGIFSNVKDFFGKEFSAAFDCIKVAFRGCKEFFQGVLRTIKGIFSPIGNWFKNIFSTAWNGIKTSWKGVKSFFSEAWKGIKGVFGNVASFFKNKFENASDSIVKAFSGIKTNLAKPLNGMVSLIEGLANKAVDAWNWIKEQLNSFSIEFPDWMPKVGGKKFGFDLKKSEHISIQRFAQGGFPEDGWFRASKGEYFGQFDDGTSYISNNRQIENGIAASVAPAVHAAVKAGIREALSEMPMQSGGDVYLDGVKVTKEVMSTAKKISKSTGTSWKMA